MCVCVYMCVCLRVCVYVRTLELVLGSERMLCCIYATGSDHHRVNNEGFVQLYMSCRTGWPGVSILQRGEIPC